MRIVCMDKAQVREHLDRANRNVKKGEELIERQAERVKELARDGHPTKIHEENLKALRDVEETLKKTRDAVRSELDENHYE
jgi:hypothetical protein